MKNLRIEILDQYKLYKKNTVYSLEGDLILLSGVNGSGKSQLLKVIAREGIGKVERIVTQKEDDGEAVVISKIFLLSFRDNINLGDEFGHFSVDYWQNYAASAWEFYSKNIKHSDNSVWDSYKTKNFTGGKLIFDDNGIKKASWRSIMHLIDLINKRYEGSKRFNLSKDEMEELLPADFIWRNENDIVQQVGNLFYIACCNRVNKQIECSKSTEVFDNDEWLKTAPWTILNRLFEKLRFKYRFKVDYEFRAPNMDENPKLRDDKEIRSLADLSDGEKAILKLALVALDEDLSKDMQLVLFDEYDAPLNPSLTEAFYHVIEEFYIRKGIQVIVTTHSPATISLAPEYAQFYEIFSQEDSSPQIVKVSQYEYDELKRANKSFYDKIKNQEERIEELEQIVHISGNKLFVEDRYDQIYKIAYLKLNDIGDLTEDNFEEKFNNSCTFSIHGNFSCGGLYHQLVCGNISNDQTSKIICLFDFDTEGFKKFEELEKKKDNNNRLFSARSGTIKDGLLLKHSLVDRYALMLPIPERLKIYVSDKTSSDCFIEVETLLSEEYLRENPKAELRSPVLRFYKMKDKQKKEFWKDLLVADKCYFDDFRPLFDRVEAILDNQ